MRKDLLLLAVNTFREKTLDQKKCVFSCTDFVEFNWCLFSTLVQFRIFFLLHIGQIFYLKMHFLFFEKKPDVDFAVSAVHDCVFWH